MGRPWHGRGGAGGLVPHDGAGAEQGMLKPT